MCAGEAKLLSAEMKVAIHIFRDVLVQPILLDGKTTYTLPREEQQAKQIEFVEDFRILEGRSVEEILMRGDLNGKEV